MENKTFEIQTDFIGMHCDTYNIFNYEIETDEDQEDQEDQEINMQGVVNNIAQVIVDYLKTELDEIIEDVTIKETISPKYYNYSTDQAILNFTFKNDLKKLFNEYTKKYPKEYSEYIEESMYYLRVSDEEKEAIFIINMYIKNNIDNFENEWKSNVYDVLSEIYYENMINQ